MSLPDGETLLEAARQAAGLADFGDTWFFGRMEKFIDSVNRDARLTEEGSAGAQGMVVNALVNRLRHVELVKQNPDIRTLPVNVSAIVVGLPRTGSTMMHRMLASAQGMTGVKWYEAQNYAPFPGEERGNSGQRREAAEGILAHMVGKIPEIMSIHPMSIDQPDEEVIILGQLFSSSMLESSYYVPGYADWLARQGSRRAYEDLREILQSLVWQDPSREGKKWVLKTPGHLMALDVAMSVFPDAKIVMTHRDPVSTVPSYCSMEAALYRMGSDDIGNAVIGEYWFERLGQWTDSFMSVRSQAAADRFVDVKYADLLADPVGQGGRVLEAAGIDVTPDVIADMGQWIEANKREDRARHKYKLSDFGLNEDMIRRKFAAYRENHLGEARPGLSNWRET